MQILEQLASERIEIYDFPDCAADVDLPGAEARCRRQFKARMPFAVVSSDQVVPDAHGRPRRVRKYPWGQVEGEFAKEHPLSFASLTNILT